MVRPLHARARPADMRLRAFIVFLVLMLVAAVALVVVREASAAVQSDSQTSELRADPDALGDEAGWGNDNETDQSSAAKTVLVSIDGRTFSRVTGAATVKDLLTQMGVVLDADHAISHDMDAKVAPGTRIVIARIDVESITEETQVPFETTEVEDASLAAGARVVQTAGQPGAATTSYLVRYADGIEVLRTKVLSTVQQQPRTEVIRVGTGPEQVSAAPSIPNPVQPPAAGQPVPQSTTATPQSTTPAADPPATTPKPPADLAPTTPSQPDPSPTQEPDVGTGVGAGTTPASAKQLARSLVSARGWNSAEFTCLDKLWQRESGWNFEAKNPYSTARGIPQAMMSIHFGKDWRTDAAARAYLESPTVQINWGLNYVQRHSKFSTPCDAYKFWKNNNWY